MGSSFVRGAVSWLQLLCFSSSTTNILYTCTQLELIPPTASDFDRIRGESLGENGGKVSGKMAGNFGKVTGVLNSTYVGIPTQVMH